MTPWLRLLPARSTAEAHREQASRGLWAAAHWLPNYPPSASLEGNGAPLLRLDGEGFWQRI